MPVGNARKDKIRTVTRATQRLATAAIITLLGSEGLHTAVANGDTRTISMHHTHRGDDITVTFKRNGRYDQDGLKKLNTFLRDWRTDDETTMDPQLYDAVWEVLREFGPDKSIHIISSYRSPRTNEMLRRRSDGVARHSLHVQGKAMDFFIPGVPLEKVREAGLRLQRGGVGFYPASGSPFVHMDVGSVRHWPRMTRDQLARVFPTGRTVHLPTDGKPLAGFALAQADVEKRGPASSSDETNAPNAFARLFGFGRKKSADDEDAGEAPAQVAPTQRARDNILAGMNTATGQLSASSETAAAAVPMPRTRPAAANLQVASAQAAQPAARSTPALGAYALAAITPNDIIRARGYWQGLPETQPENSAVRRRGTEVASADPSTGSIGPFTAPPGYGEGKPREATLAFASQIEPDPAPQRAKPMGAVIPRAAAVAANTTIASKANANRPSEVQSAPVGLNEAREAEERRREGPWMRALIMTPSVERFMSTTLYGTQDFRNLTAMLQKPSEMVVMAFAAEPNAALSHQRFQGRAIEFLATATFSTRSAAALR